MRPIRRRVSISFSVTCAFLEEFLDRFQIEVASLYAGADLEKCFQIFVTVAFGSLDSVYWEFDNFTHAVFLLYLDWFVLFAMVI